MKHAFYRTLFTMLFCMLAFALCMQTLPCHAQAGLTINGQAAVVSSSSFCDEYEDIQFDVSQAFNGRADRPWMAAERFDSRNPEWIKITFIKPVHLAGLRISPGFGHSSEMFYKYSRLKEFKVLLGDGTKEEGRTYLRHFDSVPFKDMVILFSTQPKVKTITIRILDVYPGREMTNPLIGEIEPIVVQGGSLVSTSNSQPLKDALEFLRLSSSPSRALSYVSPDKTITFKKLINYINPLDAAPQVNKTRKYTRKTLQEDKETWKDACRQMSTDYRFNTLESVCYFWREPVKGHYVFDMITSGTTDVMNSYTLNFEQHSVTETIKKTVPADKTDKTAAESTDQAQPKEITEKVTYLKAMITSLTMVQDVYAP